MDEEWRDIEGYEGYQASNQGNIRHLVDGEWITPNRYMGNGQGKYEKIYIAGKNHGTAQVSHLVAAAFIGLRPPHAVVRHKNDDWSDNRSENLVYGSQSDNMNDAKANGKISTGSARYNAKLVESDIADIISAYTCGETLDNISSRYGVASQTISNVVRGRTWQNVASRAAIPNSRCTIHNIGNGNPNAKLTEGDALEILRMHEGGIKQASIAREWHISETTVHKIVKRMHWATREG